MNFNAQELSRLLRMDAVVRKQEDWYEDSLERYKGASQSSFFCPGLKVLRLQSLLGIFLSIFST
jgi:hypothetical protein